MGFLAFAPGIRPTVVVEAVAPEAHEGEEACGVALVVVGDGALFAFLSVYPGRRRGPAATRRGRGSFNSWARTS